MGVRLSASSFNPHSTSTELPFWDLLTAVLRWSMVIYLIFNSMVSFLTLFLSSAAITLCFEPVSAHSRNHTKWNAMTTQTNTNAEEDGAMNFTLPVMGASF